MVLICLAAAVLNALTAEFANYWKECIWLMIGLSGAFAYKAEIKYLSNGFKSLRAGDVK